MIEVYVASTFTQDYLLLGTNAREALKIFIEDSTDVDDLNQLKSEIKYILGGCKNNTRSTFIRMGASYWPDDENIEETFCEGMDAIDARVRQLIRD